MFTQALRIPLRDKSTDTPEGGGGNTPAATTPVTEAPEAAEPVNTPTVFDKAKALMKSKPGLQADLTAANGQITQLTESLATANSTIATLQAENSAFKKNENDLEVHVSQLEAEQTSVAAAAADQLSALSVPEENLPGQDAGDVQSLESRYAESKKIGGAAHAKFMSDNKAEISAYLK